MATRRGSHSFPNGQTGPPAGLSSAFGHGGGRVVRSALKPSTSIASAQLARSVANLAPIAETSSGFPFGQSHLPSGTPDRGRRHGGLATVESRPAHVMRSMVRRARSATIAEGNRRVGGDRTRAARGYRRQPRAIAERGQPSRRLPAICELQVRARKLRVISTPRCTRYAVMNQ